MTDPILDDTHNYTGGDDDGATVHIGIHYPDRGPVAHFDLDTTDPYAVAEAVAHCLRGVAAMEGFELQMALTQKVRELL